MALRPIHTSDNVPPLVDGRNRSIGKPLLSWLQLQVPPHGKALTMLALDHVIAVRPYSPAVVLDLSQGAIQEIQVTDGAAFAVQNPINPTGLAQWRLTIVNKSGGAMGAVTFTPGIFQSGFVAPADGHRTTATFLLNTKGTASEQITNWCTT